MLAVLFCSLLDLEMIQLPPTKVSSDSANTSVDPHPESQTEKKPADKGRFNGLASQTVDDNVKVAFKKSFMRL